VVDKDCHFQINGEHTYDPANWRAGIMTINLTNGAGKWIDLIVEATYPAYDLIWQSGRLNDGSIVSHPEDMAEHLNKAVHVKRWAPGVFGIPGDGGGEVFFAVPSNGDVTINLSVIGWVDGARCAHESRHLASTPARGSAARRAGPSLISSRLIPKDVVSLPLAG
jgi:hypothetical protein